MSRGGEKILRGLREAVEHAARRGRAGTKARNMCPVTLEEIEAGMSAAQRARVDRLTAKMRAEEMSLAQIRKARASTQSVLAHRLGKSQALVSHIENAGDLFISTLRTQVEALGGKLEIRANFLDMPAVSIAGFVGIAADERADASSARKRLFRGKAKGSKIFKGLKASRIGHKKVALTRKGIVRAKMAAKSHRAAAKG